MKKLYRFEISGMWPVELEETAAAAMHARQLQALYEERHVPPYDLADLTLRLVPATAADLAKYGEDAGDGEA